MLGYSFSMRFVLCPSASLLWHQFHSIVFDDPKMASVCVCMLYVILVVLTHFTSIECACFLFRPCRHHHRRRSSSSFFCSVELLIAPARIQINIYSSLFMQLLYFFNNFCSLFLFSLSPPFEILGNSSIHYTRHFRSYRVSVLLVRIVRTTIRYVFPSTNLSTHTYTHTLNYTLHATSHRDKRHR